MKKVKKVAITLFVLQISLFSDQIDGSINVIKETNTQLNTYQQSISTNEEKRENLLEEYRYENLNLRNTKKYNEQMRKIMKSQEEEIVSIDKQLKDIEETKKNILPLMADMVKSLKNLVEQDIPFLFNERLARVTKLEETLDRADISTHEKYRIILETLKIEYDFAKTIEAYQGDIDGITYNFLRIGRTALYYQSLDLSDYGYYNKYTKKWEKIDDAKSKSEIRKGIKIARKQQNVDLLKLPFLSAQGAGK